MFNLLLIFRYFHFNSNRQKSHYSFYLYFDKLSFKHVLIITFTVVEWYCKYWRLQKRRRSKHVASPAAACPALRSRNPSGAKTWRIPRPRGRPTNPYGTTKSKLIIYNCVLCTSVCLLPSHVKLQNRFDWNEMKFSDVIIQVPWMGYIYRR